MLTFPASTPEAAGVSSRAVTRMMRRLERRHVPMHSILVVRHGKLICEAYYDPVQKEDLQRMFSVTKTLTALGIGLLRDEGKLSLSDPIVSFFPDKLPQEVHPWIREMTIRDMLTMRTCHASTTYKVDMESDWVESFFTVPPTHRSGTVFHYDTSSAHTLCALVERLSGQSVLDYVRGRLPMLGLSRESYVLKDPFGVSIGGSGWVCTSLDFLKFAWLLFNGGRIEGEQVVSEDYIREMTSLQVSNAPASPLPSEGCGYGYQLWIGEKGGPVCYGMGGQLAILLPKEDMLVVTTADTIGMAGGNQLIYNALYEELLPALRKEELPEDADAANELRDLCASAAIRPVVNERGESALPQEVLTSGPFASVVGKWFSLDENGMGFEAMRLELDAGTQTGACSFRLKGEEGSFSFGFGKLAVGVFPTCPMRCAASAAILADGTLYVHVHIIDSYLGNLRFQFSAARGELTVFMKRNKETLYREFDGHLHGSCQER